MSPAMRQILERLDTVQDSIREDIGHVNVNLASLRTETREVAVELRAHEGRDLERFEGIHSDIRELRNAIAKLDQKIVGVEDTSRSHMLSSAQAEVALVRAELGTKRQTWHAWQIMVATGAVSFLLGLLARLVLGAAGW